jgi:hypothetical protein
VKDWSFSYTGGLLKVLEKKSKKASTENCYQKQNCGSNLATKNQALLATLLQGNY